MARTQWTDARKPTPPQTQDVAQRLCGELQTQLERLRRGKADSCHNCVGFLGTTGSGKSFLMDMLLILLSVSPEEYNSGRTAREVRDAITRSLEDVPSAADAPPPESLGLAPSVGDEDDTSPTYGGAGGSGGALFGTARLRLKNMPPLSWREELRALAGACRSVNCARDCGSCAHKLARQA